MVRWSYITGDNDIQNNQSSRAKFDGEIRVPIGSRQIIASRYFMFARLEKGKGVVKSDESRLYLGNVYIFLMQVFTE